jgi:hypothetical protein
MKHFYATPLVALVLSATLLLSGFQRNETIVARRRAAAGGGGVAITYASIACDNSAAAATTLSCSSSMVVPANTLVVLACDADQTVSTMTGTDEAANSYTSLGSSLLTTSVSRIQLFAFYYSAGATHTPKCTYNIGTGTYRQMITVGYSGVASASFQDSSQVTGTNSGTASTAATTSSSITATQCGDVFVEYGMSDGAGTTSASAPFTMRRAPSGNGNGMADRISTTTATQAGAMTVPSGHWGLLLVALKAASHC